MIPPFPAYIFDLDGTLVDSAADICGAIRTVLEKTSQSGVGDAFLRRYIGLHLLDLFQDLFPSYSGAEIEALIVEYRAVYAERRHRATQVYPGVLEALSRLPGKKATATIKGTPMTRLVLEQFGLLPMFDHVQGTDGFPSKPAPDIIFTALRGLGAEAKDCLMVGDSAADMQAGRAAGVKICAVRYGYGAPDELARCEPDYWISDLRELVGGPGPPLPAAAAR